jgi:hypothetical protein
MSLPKQASSAIDPWLNHAVQAFDRDKKSDGDMLTHEWIKWALEVREPKTLSDASEIQWVLLSRVEAFKDYLLVERQIALANVRGEGYRILPPCEQARYAAEQALKSIKRGFDQGSKLLTHARLAEMDYEARKRHTDTEVRLAGIKQIVQREKRVLMNTHKLS